MSGSIRTGRGTHDELAHVHAIGLCDGIRNGLRYGLRWQGDAAERNHGLARGWIGDVIGQFGLDHAGADQRHPDGIGLLAQPIGDGAHCELAGAIDRRRRPHLMRADRGDVDDVPMALRLHDRQHGGNAVQHAAHVDV